ncbi:MULTISPECIES: NAD(P)/FAD-dependent oxidoreductase [unclassified Uliginosibacterium]|uniref:NAD(P)/FAD-dependent oxidoreductase n=1 Tax=unclassified Uliginosibacterium TaxID=2621521 RepID=UPI000C7D6069|nr:MULTISPECIES: NAD(P)/FAD-dependent oxidoreductase [unclassified Uliginosibacterium]MDO6388117.1 NAD(P)/FAD-dependent oxidoreductase [Uliginosibacterium sp. 31-12]PLK49076.1 FAD-dependent oxidoreductase [Uliginosibacterium sp. TH139]
MSDQKRPVVIIVGAGFGGLSAARALASAEVDIVLVDQRNHHIFQPLLYQVATASLSPADIAGPVRSILSSQPNVTVVLGTVTGIDSAARSVSIDNGVRSGAIAYDYLILATGARHAYFGNDHWEPYAPGLKTIEDATSIRRRLLWAFERAEMATDIAERDANLTIVIVGGGPTGVELAGSIIELARAALAKDFRRIDPRKARVLLVEAGPRILPSFTPELSEAAKRSLEKLGVSVRVNARVMNCDAEGVVIGEERVPAATILWAAGVQASPAAGWLGAAADRAGRVLVGPDFSVPGHEGVFAIGDTASLTDVAGQVVPGVAPAAKQAGRYVGDMITRRLSGFPQPAPFRYRNYGNLATIGRYAAVADFGWIRLRGALAWWLWGIAHIFFLIDFRNRVAVTLGWLWSFLTFKRGARLITGMLRTPGK